MKFKDHMLIVSETIKLCYNSINYKKLYNTLIYMDQKGINPYLLNEIDIYRIYNDS